MNNHGGNINELARRADCTPEEILDFSASINPMGPPEFFRAAVSRALNSIENYPPPQAEPLLEVAAESYQVPIDFFTAGNGSGQLIFALTRACGLTKALISAPSYIDYEKACIQAGFEIAYFELSAADNFVPHLESLEKEIKPGMLVFIGHPGNPAGSAMEANDIRQLAARCPEALIVVDEAFADFLPQDFSLLPEVPENVIILRSLTKFFAVPGLRLGFAIAHPQITAKLREEVPSWSVNSIAQEVGVRLLRDTEEYAEETRRLATSLKQKLSNQLIETGKIIVFPGVANFLLIKLKEDIPGFADKLLELHRCAIRSCSNFKGLDDTYFRIGLKNEVQNDFLVEAIKNVLENTQPKAFHIPTRKHKPSLMLQGTCSNAGKSVLTSAFCRILLQDGYNVAPFKSQNMALNSFVTADGEEMGRAQVVQAAACRLQPDVRMNPVLLKPSTDTGCQVIYMGHPVDNMAVGKYFNYKAQIFDKVKAVYDSLEKDFDVIVLEGAGSPGEMNLKKSDIVNMNMARHSESTVLLAGDIDRGGTYASFIGTVESFLPWERDLLKGFLVNKFRGDASLLQAAHDYVEDFTGKPVLGVIPYVRDLRIPEEDSVAFGLTRPCEKFSETLDLAIIALDHVSNFTDFDPFEIEPDIKLRKVRNLKDLGSPDIIVLPGSKNVIGDLQVLRRQGMDGAIIELVKQGSWLIGICGGLQMVGSIIEDPHQLESHSGSEPGLGLLPLITVLREDKQLFQTTAYWLPEDMELSGYEIHHGETTCSDDALITVVSEDNRPIGFAAERVWTTYLHGVFDDDAFRRKFIDMIRHDRKMVPLQEIQAGYDIQDAIDCLADTVRESVDIDRIYQLMGLK